MPPSPSYRRLLTSRLARLIASSFRASIGTTRGWYTCCC